MICDCELITKKRTILDGIKSVSGRLLVFKIYTDDDNFKLFIKRCCFLTLIPSMYTFVDKSWLMYSNIIIFDPKSPQADPTLKQTLGSELSIQNVFDVRQETIDRIQEYGDSNFEVIIIDHAKLIVPEYMKATTQLNMAYQKIIELDQTMNSMKYKLSSVDLTKCIISESTQTDEASSSTDIVESECTKCKSIQKLRERIKELRNDTFQRVDKLQYEIDILRKTSSDLQRENDKLKEANDKLKDLNQSYFLTR